MKCISLWQPWTTLIAIGAKQYETRSWQTPYRGPLAIHAARTKDAIHICAREPFKSVLLREGINALAIDLPYGKVLCVADLVDCIPTERIRGALSEQELAFGDYSNGRYAWKLVNVRCFKNPVTLSGKQGLFDAFLPMKDLQP